MGGVMAEQIIESLRRLMEQSRENEGVEGAALADRKEYIENVLMTKVCTASLEFRCCAWAKPRFHCMVAYCRMSSSERIYES